MAKEKTTSFKEALAQANSGKRFPVIALTRESPQLASMISKLVAAPLAPTYGRGGQREPTLPNTHVFHNKARRTADNISDSQTVMQMLPDIELAAQILVSSILSPKDMMTTEITYNVQEGLLSSDVSGSLIQAAYKYFENDYKIKPKLPEMLRDMLFDTGSYAVAVIPENSIDEVINGARKVTMESLNAHGWKTHHTYAQPVSLGLLGPATRAVPREERNGPGLSLEDLHDRPATSPDIAQSKMVLSAGDGRAAAMETYITVSDNPDLLKLPQIHQRVRESRITSAIHSKPLRSLTRALEAMPGQAGPGTTVTDRLLTEKLFKHRQGSFKPIVTMKTQDQLNRKTVGNPLVLHLPSESVLPVHVPGTPEAHVGYFILLDMEGNPISRDEQTDYYRELETRMQSNGNFATAMLSKMKQMTNGAFNPTEQGDLEMSTRVYGEMIEQDLLARLRNGVYGKGIAIAKRDEVFRVMLARSLAQQQTQMLFLPAELMTYFAFKFGADGIGKSLLDDMKIINSLRAMLTFSNVMASLKNSIGRTNVNMKLDPDDPDPSRTIEIATHEIIRSRSNSFPIGLNKPTDLVDFLQKAAYEITFEGHPGVPDVKMDFTEKNSQYVKADTELEEQLRKRSTMGLGLSPENIDAGFSAEFATSILQNNLLLSKRVMQYQEGFTPQLTDHHRKVMLNSESLLEEFREILNSNFDSLKTYLTDEAKEMLKGDAGGKEGASADAIKQAVVDHFIHEFIMAFEVQLPQPNSVTLDNQLAAFDKYVEGLDKVLEAYISPEYFTSTTGGDVMADIGTLRALVKSYFIRNWLAENGVMTEVSTLTTVDSEGKSAANVFEATENHIEGLVKSLTGFLVNLAPIKRKADEKLQTVGATPEDTTTPPTDDTGGDDSGAGDDLSGDMPTLDEPDTTDLDTEETEPADANRPQEGSNSGDAAAKKEEGDDKNKEPKAAGSEDAEPKA